MITHHLSDKLLMAYSAGTLPEAFNLVVATHISVCDECRANLASFDAVGGALLDEDYATMGAESLATVMARIKSGAPTTKPEPRPRDTVLPRTAGRCHRRWVGPRAMARGRWRCAPGDPENL